MRRMILAVAVVCALLSGAVYAQLASNEVYVNQSFQIEYTDASNGTNWTSAKLYRNGVQVADIAKATVLANGKVLFPARTEAAVGTVTYEAALVNSDGTTTLEGPKSVALSLVVKPALVTPGTLTLPRIIRLGS